MTLELHHGRGYVPLRVVAHLGEPIAYLGDGLHLDGFLSYAAYHDLDEATRRTIPPVTPDAWPRDFRLPVSTWSTDAPAAVDDRLCRSRGTLSEGWRMSDGRVVRHDVARGERTERRLWGYCSSAAREEAWSLRGKIEVRKRPATTQMARYTEAKSHDLGSGPGKAYDLAFPTVLTDSWTVEWYAHGDRDEVQRLLSTYVDAIGKKRNIGMGIVIRWVVEVVDQDRSTVVDGVAQRHLPFGAAEGARVIAAIRPPYYHRSRIIEAVRPC